MKSKGLGDSIEKFTKATGIKKVVDTMSNIDLDPSDCARVIDHEMVHINQMKRGDLDYDDDFVYWKGKKYSRAEMDEGNKKLPWEDEAYKNA